MSLKLGERFTVSSGALRISDPCYENGTWCATTIDKVRDGVWIGYPIQRPGDAGWGPPGHQRNMALIAFHADGNALDETDFSEMIGADIGVDSGQCGIHDEAFATANIGQGEFGDLATFYGRACAATLTETSPHGFGVVDGQCVVSSSGYGDGSYRCYVVRDGSGADAEVVGVMIDFGLLEEDDDEDDDDSDSATEDEEDEEDQAHA